MSAISITQLQTAIFSRLDDQLSEPVYSYVPPESTFPYVRIGDIIATDISNTKDDDLIAFTATIHVFDKDEGSNLTLNGLIESVYAALHDQSANLSMLGFTAVSCRCNFVTTRQEGQVNDNYWHGIMRFALLVEYTPEQLPLSSFLDNVIFDYSATVLDSYSGTGQLWTDLVTGDQHSFGATASPQNDDPQFTGDAMLFGGDDLFQFIGATPEYYDVFHQSNGNDFSWAMRGTFKGNDRIWATDGGRPSVDCYVYSSGNMLFRQFNAAGAAANFSFVGGAIPIDQEVTIAMSYKKSTGEAKLYVDGVLADSVTVSFLTETGSCGGVPRIGASSGNKVSNGTLISEFMGANKEYNAAEMLTLAQRQAARHEG